MSDGFHEAVRWTGSPADAHLPSPCLKYRCILLSRTHPQGFSASRPHKLRVMGAERDENFKRVFDFAF